MSDAASPSPEPAPAVAPRTPRTAQAAALLAKAGAWLVDNAEFCAILGTLVGFLLCATSMILGIDSVSFTGDFRVPALANTHIDLGHVDHKEVGYLWALNWAFYGAIIMPLWILFGLLTFRQIEPTIIHIAQRGMIRDGEHFKPVSADALLAQWRHGEAAWRILIALVFVFGLAFIAYDGWKVVSDPIADPAVLQGKLLSDPAYEFDWSISCLFRGSGTDCGALQAFGALGYALIPGISTVFAFIVVLVALRFMAFIASAGNHRNQWLVFVDVNDSRHCRFGWGAFEGFFSCLLYFAITVLFGLWLMVVQNSYLRDPDSDSVFKMIFSDSKDILEGTNANNFLDALESNGIVHVLRQTYNWIFEEPSRFFFANWQTGIGVILFGFVAASAVIGSWWLLRATARKSQQVALERASTLAPEAGMDAKSFKRKLRRMRFWPVAWIDQLPLFALMVVMFGSLFSYRLILVAFALIIGTLLGGVFSSMGKSYAAARRHAEDDEDDEDD